MVLLERRGFTESHFRELHPGGTIGVRLLKVREIMHQPVPALEGDSSIREAISLMSKGEVRGACAVLSEGKLVGVLTDGDLRRLLEKDANPLARKVKDCASAQPRTIDAEEFVERAIFLMEQFRISVLFVTESGRSVPVGILHVQDLLKVKAR
jgi:arabinose-5-phosphate isomerase